MNEIEFFNRSNSDADHGRRKGEQATPGFWEFQQKRLFLVSSGKKKIRHFWLPYKKFGKISSWPPQEKSFRRPWCWS